MAGSPDSEASIIPSLVKPVVLPRDPLFDLVVGAGGLAVSYSGGRLLAMSENGYLPFVRKAYGSSGGAMIIGAALSDSLEAAPRVISLLADGMIRKPDWRHLNSDEPLVNESCLAEIIDHYFTDELLARMQLPEKPRFFARAFNLNTNEPEYLDVSLHGRDALHASCTMTSTWKIGDVLYTDTAFRAPLDVHGTYPRLIMHHNTHRSLRNKAESGYFLAKQFGIGGWLGYVVKHAREVAALDRLGAYEQGSARGGTGSPFMVVSPNMDIAFSTTDKDVLKRAWDKGYEEGNNDAMKRFIDSLFERKHGYRRDAKQDVTVLKKTENPAVLAA